MATLKESLTYTPVELKFGTSGLRGLVTEMTDLECYINTQGFISFLETSDDKNNKTIAIAGDLRDSTPRILQAVATAIKDAGYNFSFQGYVPTPTLAYYAQEHAIPCIMVTGSHIPADRNGIKFYKSSGEILKSDESAIFESVAAVRLSEYSSVSEKFTSNGSLVSKVSLPEQSNEAIKLYIDRYVDFFGNSSLNDLRVVFYQHSAVGRDLLVEILQKLGAKVEVTGRSDVFVPIDTENVTEEDAKYFTSLANEFNNPFAIVSTDGDSDRPFVIDENGVFYRGDILGAVVANWLQADYAAYPISTCDAVDEYFTSAGIPYIHTRIGSPYVIDAMDAAIESGKERVVGWEVNGGFLLGTKIESSHGTLKKLPTRDALLPIIIALLAAKEGNGVKEAFNGLLHRFTDAGLIDDFPIESSKKIIEVLSGDPVKAKALISEVFISYGDVKSINTLDGIRITFESGEIAHLRPSGNAPQLRIYSVADTEVRAHEIVTQAIAEPNGIFRSLEEKVL